MKIAVIGGGPGGYVAAIKAAMLGGDVTVIEKKKVGGTCLNVGCIPTKALLASSSMLMNIKEAKNFGINIDGKVNADFSAVMSRKDKIVDQLISGIEFLFDKRGINLVNGFGKLIDKNTIEVTKEDGEIEIIKADKIILANGSVPIVPPMFPYDKKRIITSDEVLGLSELPESMLIIGGGVIGCEIGQFFSTLGTEVTIVQRGEQLLPFEDKDVVKLMGEAMSDMGGYIILAFVASQFLQLFTNSNLGIIIAVKGGEFLENAGIGGPALLVGFIILSCFINLFIGSASAKWAILAPIFVPMFMMVGYNPALTQMAYRIGDCITNPLSPLFPYFPIILAFTRKYDEEAGMGTIIANMLPYSITFLIVWTLLLILFMVFNIPLGPGILPSYSLH